MLGRVTPDYDWIRSLDEERREGTGRTPDRGPGTGCDHKQQPTADAVTKDARVFRKTHVFRDVTDGAVTLTEGFEVVDVVVNAAVWNQISAGRRVSNPVVDLSWDGGSRADHVTSSFEVHHGQSQDYVIRILQGLFRERHARLRGLTRTLYTEHGAKLTSLVGAPFTLRMTHRCQADHDKMAGSILLLEHSIRQTFLEITGLFVAVNLRMSQCSRTRTSPESVNIFDPRRLELLTECRGSEAPWEHVNRDLPPTRAEEHRFPLTEIDRLLCTDVVGFAQGDVTSDPSRESRGVGDGSSADETCLGSKRPDKNSDLTTLHNSEASESYKSGQMHTAHNTDYVLDASELERQQNLTLDTAEEHTPSSDMNMLGVRPRLTVPEYVLDVNEDDQETHSVSSETSEATSESTGESVRVNAAWVEEMNRKNLEKQGLTPDTDRQDVGEVVKMEEEVPTSGSDGRPKADSASDNTTESHATCTDVPPPTSDDAETVRETVPADQGGDDDGALGAVGGSELSGQFGSQASGQSRSQVEADYELAKMLQESQEDLQGERRCKPDVESDTYSRLLELTHRAKGILNYHGMGESSTSFEHLQETLEIALVDHDPMPPKAHAISSVLCLDTSSSMGKMGFQQMKEIALEFVEGIEDNAAEYDREENVAVITFGGRSRIAHHLSNDYGSIKDTIDNLAMGGYSPLFEALFVCVACVDGRGAALSIGGVYTVLSRIIVVTDGKASYELDGGANDTHRISSNELMRLMQLVKKLGRHTRVALPLPIVWIPAGDADMKFLEGISKLPHGRLVDREGVKELTKYSHKQDVIGKVLIFARENGDLRSRDGISPLVDAFAGDLTNEEKNEVMEKVLYKLGHPDEGLSDGGVEGGMELESLPPLGTRVARGPDWRSGDKDARGPGTVVAHLSDDLLCVQWDNGGEHKHMFGASVGYEVFEVEGQPRFPSSDSSLEVGCQVTRGPDWKTQYGRQDGGHGGVGVVIGKDVNNGVVRVRWQKNGHKDIYRYDNDGQFEVILRDPLEVLQESGWRERSDQSGPKPGREPARQPAPVVEKPHHVWQWRDRHGRWRLYSENNTKKLEKDYARKPTGSCLIQRDGQSCRVSFERKQERSTSGGDGSVVEVRRLSVDDTERDRLRTEDASLR